MSKVKNAINDVHLVQYDSPSREWARSPGTGSDWISKEEGSEGWEVAGEMFVSSLWVHCNYVYVAHATCIYTLYQHVVSIYVNTYSFLDVKHQILCLESGT